MVRFFPDGTANSAAFIVGDAIGGGYRVRIRGLTGAITLERLKRQEAAPP
jgi:hypothetical protein